MASNIEPRGQELVERYRSAYRLPEDMVVTEQMALDHWNLERELTGRLLESKPENRWKVFDESYTLLYERLPWLNRNPIPDIEPADYYSDWIPSIGPVPRRIYEVGSGVGLFIKLLASMGYDCVGTDVTIERGVKFDEGQPNLRWANTDGVHLGRFEEAGRYDVVISDQVIEHLHPDDLVEHFRGALSILKPGGSYIFRTPHYCGGPCDVSRIFKADEAKGMHLKEYTYREVARALEEAGFANVEAVPGIPYRIRRMTGLNNRPNPSRVYLEYLKLVEAPIRRIRFQPARYYLTMGLSAMLLFRIDVFVRATKASA